MYMFAHRKGSGFTLVEVMVSMVIFLIASMGLLPLLLTSMQVNRNNHLHAQAQRLASEVMAELQVADFASLATISDEPLLFGNIEILQQIDPGQPQPEQSRITVTANWRQQGRTHLYQLQTVRSAP